MSKTCCRHSLYLICLILVLIPFGCGDGGSGKDSSATLSWAPPTTNTEGTELTDLAGYKVYYGTSPGSYETDIDVGNTTTYTTPDISPATYYFAVTAYDEMGNESDYSNEVSTTIQP